MIIVEGPDGAGKTTLCEWICKQFNLEMGERSGKNRDKIYKTTRFDTWTAMYEECVAMSPPVVWDRLGPYSDPIYSSNGIPVNRPCEFTRSEQTSFHRWVLHPAFGCLILCLPPLETVLENVSEGHQLEGVPERTRQIYRDYCKLNPFGGWFVYDYKNANTTGVSLLISNHLRQRKERENLASSS